MRGYDDDMAARGVVGDDEPMAKNNLQGALSNLEVAMEQLSKGVSVLEDRLSPIFRKSQPEMREGDPNMATKEDQGHSEMYEHIQGLTHRINTLSDHLAWMHRQVQL